MGPVRALGNNRAGLGREAASVASTRLTLESCFHGASRNPVWETLA